MDDQRPLSAGERAFFTLGTGSGIFVVIFFCWNLLNISVFLVPVVLIFTKFDALVDKCYSNLRQQGKNHQEAKALMHESADKTFQNEYLLRMLAMDCPPKAYVSLAGNTLSIHKIFNFSQILGMDKEENQCSELSEKTMHWVQDPIF